MIKRPKVTTRCPADHYHGARERVIEFSSMFGGGLISFLETEECKLLVQVYRQDETVIVTASKEKG